MKNNLDYYLTQDHAARGLTMAYAIVAGTLVGAGTQLASFSSHESLGLCVSTVAFIQLVRALRCGKGSQRGSRTTIVLPVRRYLLRAAFLSIGIFILAILRIPRIEAAAADRRLREMTSEDPLPFEKVDALINFAIQNRIPIRSDSITAAQVKVLAAAKATSGPTVSPPASTTFARLEAYALYNVADVRLQLSGAIILRAEPATFYAPVFARSMSMLGLSRTESIIDVKFKRTAAMAAAINYNDAAMGSDALVARMTVTGQELALSDAPEFILKQPEAEPHKVVVLGVTVSNLRQTLDRLVWIDVLFDKCLIVYGGGPIHLEAVRFRDCEFSADEVSGEIFDYIGSRKGQPVTLN